MPSRSARCFPSPAASGEDDQTHVINPVCVACIVCVVCLVCACRACRACRVRVCVCINMSARARVHSRIPAPRPCGAAAHISTTLHPKGAGQARALR